MRLVGVDLDGVIALENRESYFQAKAEGASALRHYYQTLEPNKELINVLSSIRQTNFHLQYRMYTARKNDLPDMKDLTYNWLNKHQVRWLFDIIVFTKFSWKYEAVLDGCSAMIDNDHVMLSRLPFIKRWLYRPFVRENKSIWFNCTDMSDVVI